MPIVESRLKNGLLTIDGTPFATQASNVTLSPDVDEEGDTLEVLSGEEILPTEKTSWTLGIEAIQDFDDVQGFVNYCFQNAGDVVPFTWRPSAAGVSYAGSVKIRAVEIGGDVNTRLSTSAEFPCQGTPVATYPAP